MNGERQDLNTAAGNAGDPGWVLVRAADLQNCVGMKNCVDTENNY